MNQIIDGLRAYSDRLNTRLVATPVEDKAKVLHALATGLSRCTELFLIKGGGEQLELSPYEKGAVDAWESALRSIGDALDTIEQEHS